MSPKAESASYGLSLVGLSPLRPPRSLHYPLPPVGPFPTLPLIGLLGLENLRALCDRGPSLCAHRAAAFPMAALDIQLCGW